MKKFLFLTLIFNALFHIPLRADGVIGGDSLVLVDGDGGGDGDNRDGGDGSNSSGPHGLKSVSGSGKGSGTQASSTPTVASDPVKADPATVTATSGRKEGTSGDTVSVASGDDSTSGGEGDASRAVELPSKLVSQITNYMKVLDLTKLQPSDIPMFITRLQDTIKQSLLYVEPIKNAADLVLNKMKIIVDRINNLKEQNGLMVSVGKDDKQVSIAQISNEIKSLGLSQKVEKDGQQVTTNPVQKQLLDFLYNKVPVDEVPLYKALSGLEQSEAVPAIELANIDIFDKSVFDACKKTQNIKLLKELQDKLKVFGEKLDLEKLKNNFFVTHTYGYENLVKTVSLRLITLKLDVDLDVLKQKLSQKQSFVNWLLGKPVESSDADIQKLQSFIKNTGETELDASNLDSVKHLIDFVQEMREVATQKNSWWWPFDSTAKKNANKLLTDLGASPDSTENQRNAYRSLQVRYINDPSITNKNVTDYLATLSEADKKELYDMWQKTTLKNNDVARAREVVNAITLKQLAFDSKRGTAVGEKKTDDSPAVIFNNLLQALGTRKTGSFSGITSLDNMTDSKANTLANLDMTAEKSTVKDPIEGRLSEEADKAIINVLENYYNLGEPGRDGKLTQEQRETAQAIVRSFGKVLATAKLREIAQETIFNGTNPMSLDDFRTKIEGAYPVLAKGKLLQEVASAGNTTIKSDAP